MGPVKGLCLVEVLSLDHNLRHRGVGDKVFLETGFLFLGDSLSFAQSIRFFCCLF